ncbi:hydantoinase/oxoprolinase N-terminal domain-containing protein [Roseovarius atlanticus]|uniref:hydantoinase/oxoprolinase N-terminal domain-containing protein n=1 Tax=Roseovarius atlanticus TaxID=1641875 RepID=UPI001C97317F|nr:hydantoinase/oxoprolinase family protein [Roseovarius atlanticus]MBY5987232.1 hydantoinase/oxoprolinase family protein [Roseovarius atlanticus]MBY6125872.1 hydantoinase/oxoprolinase family protein [Roseovarius atlanticus]MBY6149667.1 hydantoinase/oxoprolinase family protein [Roseovarius atlanticus]
MAILLGVDTGGTYTDAVLVRDEREVIASAKALTTRQDLSIGIGDAIEAVLTQSGVTPDQIGLASLSTTLATNALVEGQGGRVGLVYIGFRERDLDMHGLTEALAGDPALVLGGGHNHAGSEAAALDETALSAWLETDLGASAFAIASQFATRNPSHELRVAEMIRAATGKPVSCSHHLSAKLNGPKRALTALLNARLVGMIARLIEKAEGTLTRFGIDAPLMVVRGDGALISSAQARERPIETILSGPAASIVGARWMTGADHALVSDIGGTTTDVAVLRDGRPMIDPAGAQVGPWRTMVEAVAMRTTGLGGDSEVHVIDEGLVGGVTLGPRRVIPVSLIALEDPAALHAVLDDQLRNDTPGEHDGRFVRLVPGVEADGLGPKDTALLERIGTGVKPLGAVLRNRMDSAALRRLVARGLVQVAGVTPSDASHVLGRLDAWDAEAARKAVQLVGRKRTGNGNRLCPDPEAMAQMIVDQLTDQTSLALLETAFAEDDHDFGLPAAQLARHVLMQKGLDRHRGLVRLDTGLNVPVIGLGASASNYYPAVGARLGCDMILPEHAGVANAIGAVVGRVTIRRQGTITSPAEGRFRVHLETGPEDFVESEKAMERLIDMLKSEARRTALAAGAEDLQTGIVRDIKTAQAEGRDVFLEAVITVEVSGRPRIAS